MRLLILKRASNLWTPFLIFWWYNLEIGMDKNHPVGDSAKSKILLIVLILLTVISVGYTFYKTVVQQDFEIVNTEPITE